MKNWELCPKCNGDGQYAKFEAYNYHHSLCDLCNGHKVISAFTGKPPKGELATISVPAINVDKITLNT